jgi:hypothetical protein
LWTHYSASELNVGLCRIANLSERVDGHVERQRLMQKRPPSSLQPRSGTQWLCATLPSAMIDVGQEDHSGFRRDSDDVERRVMLLAAAERKLGIGAKSLLPSSSPGGLHGV